jgi:hypothetical protein
VTLYLFWRDRLRHEIDTWGERQRWVFYGSFALILVDLAIYFWPGQRGSLAGFRGLSFVLVLLLAGYAMWRVWKSERTLYS